MGGSVRQQPRKLRHLRRRPGRRPAPTSNPVTPFRSRRNPATLAPGPSEPFRISVPVEQPRPGPEPLAGPRARRLRDERPHGRGPAPHVPAVGAARSTQRRATDRRGVDLAADRSAAPHHLGRLVRRLRWRPSSAGSGRLEHPAHCRDAAQTQQSLASIRRTRRRRCRSRGRSTRCWSATSAAMTAAVPGQPTRREHDDRHRRGGARRPGWPTLRTRGRPGRTPTSCRSPYGDPDIVAAVRAGFDNHRRTRGRRPAAPRCSRCSARSRACSRRTPGRPAGFADQRTVNGCWRSVTARRPVRRGAARRSPRRVQTPSAPATLTTAGGPVDAVLTDPVLSTTVSQGVDNPDGSRVSLQRFLAETLMIHAEAPSTPGRDVVVAPNRRWAADAGVCAARCWPTPARCRGSSRSSLGPGRCCPDRSDR